MGEVFNGNPYTFCPYQDYLDGMLNYPAYVSPWLLEMILPNSQLCSYFWITRAFDSTSGSMTDLATGINTMVAQCTDTSLLGSFLENHDEPRFSEYTSDMSLTKNAIGFTMLSDGIPIIYQGQEQHYSGGAVPTNREALWLSGYDTTATLYAYITKINKIRAHAKTQDSSYLTDNASPVYTDSSTIVMRKGTTGTQVIAIFSNAGSSGNNSFTLTSAKSGFTSAQAVTDLIACTAYTTDSIGNLVVNISNGLPQVLYPTAQLSGNGLCGSSNTSSTSEFALMTCTTQCFLINITGSASASSTRGSTTLSTSTRHTSTSATCTAAAVTVPFEQEVSTLSGQTVKLVGSIAQLGSWNTSLAIILSDEDYTTCDPYW